MVEQKGLCPLCNELLPERGAVLDRTRAVDGYSAENTRLIHAACDVAYQAAKSYAWGKGGFRARASPVDCRSSGLLPSHHAPRYPFRYLFSGDLWANVPVNQLLEKGGTLIPSPAQILTAV